MSKVYFKKTVENKIFISDNKEKYEIEHPYFSFNTEEVPYDSNIFKNCLATKQIVVIAIDDDFKSSIDFTQYQERDEMLETKKIEDKKILKAMIKEKERLAKNDEKVKEKVKIQKEKQIEKKKEEEKNIDVISDSEILNKL